VGGGSFGQHVHGKRGLGALLDQVGCGGSNGTALTTNKRPECPLFASKAPKTPIAWRGPLASLATRVEPNQPGNEHNEMLSTKVGCAETRACDICAPRSSCSFCGWWEERAPRYRTDVIHSCHNGLPRVTYVYVIQRVKIRAISVLQPHKIFLPTDQSNHHGAPSWTTHGSQALND